jgi:hypothetical protein
VKRKLWPTSIRAEGDKLGRQTLLCSAIYDFVHLARISSISPYSRKTSKDSFASRLINYKLVHPLCSKRIAKPGKAGIAKIACRSEPCSAKSAGDPDGFRCLAAVEVDVPSERQLVVPTLSRALQAAVVCRRSRILWRAEPRRQRADRRLPLFAL